MGKVEKKLLWPKINRPLADLEKNLGLADK